MLTGPTRSFRRPAYATAVFVKSAVSNDDTSALVAKSANLAFLPGSELRWASVYLKRGRARTVARSRVRVRVSDPVLERVHGLRVDVMSRRTRAGPLFSKAGCIMGHLGPGREGSDSFAFGTTLSARIPICARLTACSAGR